MVKFETYIKKLYLPISMVKGKGSCSVVEYKHQQSIRDGLSFFGLQA